MNDIRTCCHNLVMIVFFPFGVVYVFFVTPLAWRSLRAGAGLLARFQHVEPDLR